MTETETISWMEQVGIINVPTKVGESNWRACFIRADNFSEIFGINEAISRDAKRFYASIARKTYHGFFGLAKSPNPVFWDRNLYKRIRGEVHILHTRGGSTLAKRYPGFNDARYVTEVELQDRQGYVPNIVVLCTHWVPEGKKVPEVWRKWARNEAKRKVRAIARRNLRQGKTVWFIGDTNIGEAFDFGIRGATFEWLRGDGIDKIGVWTPKGTRVNRSHARVYPAPTDHKHGVAGRAFLTRTTRLPS